VLRADNETPSAQPAPFCAGLETVHNANVVRAFVYKPAFAMSVPGALGSATANLEVESPFHSKPSWHKDTIYTNKGVLYALESMSEPEQRVVTVEEHATEVCSFRHKPIAWKRDSLPEHKPPSSEGALEKEDDR
jgi:hypothetical protein